MNKQIRGLVLPSVRWIKAEAMTISEKNAICVSISAAKLIYKRRQSPRRSRIRFILDWLARSTASPLNLIIT